MDIDTETPIDSNSAFSIVLPLPYRCLLLVGIGILGWATNLHGLYFLGVDTGYALDIRRSGSMDNEYENPAIPTAVSSSRMNRGMATFAHPSTLYRPIYKIFVTYGVLVFTSWLLFLLLSGGSPDEMDSSKIIPSLTFLAVLVSLFWPFSFAQKHERYTFLRATLRCLVPSFSQPIHFADIILADIFTSFAKVLGDFWLAIRILSSSGHLWQLPLETGMSQWITPCLMSLPYAIRFRQCIAEYFTTKSSKPLFNAAKYATAFPVIFLSAAQRMVPEAKTGIPHGEHPLFRIWALSVFINSVYSFWWDVVNDWGLTLLKPSSMSSSKRRHSMPSVSLGGSHSRMGSQIPKSPSPAIDLDPDFGTQYAGLRSQLLFQDPLIYYVAIFINFVLRFTWSLKLSSHLHHVADLEVGVFMIEALEVLRRWIWVFIRVEWEMLKLGREAENNDEEYEFLMREGGETDASDVSM